MQTLHRAWSRLRQPLLLAAALLFFLSGVSSSNALKSVDSAAPSAPVPIANVLSFVRSQYERVYQHWLTDKADYPNYGEPSEPQWRTLAATRDSFTNGFFPGKFLYLHDFANDSASLQRGVETTLPLASISTHVTTHDIGFVMVSSFGHLHRITRNESYLDVLRVAAHSLATRFSPVVHCTRSWDGPTAPDFQVIIDNVQHTH